MEAPAKRLHHVTFTLRPGTTDAVREALERSGTPVIEPPPAPPRTACGCATRTAPPCSCSTNPRRRPGRPPRCWSTWAAPASGSTSRSGDGHRGRAAAPARALAAVHRAARADDGLLHPGARAAGQRHDPPRPGDVPQRRARRPPRLRVHLQHPPRLPPRQLRGPVHRRDRVGADRMRGQGATRRAGAWAATPSDRTSSTTTPTRGARGSSGSPTSTRSTTAGWPRLGRPPHLWGRRRPRPSSPTQSPPQRRSEP
jgi:hypothetical protein